MSWVLRGLGMNLASNGSYRPLSWGSSSIGPRTVNLGIDVDNRPPGELLAQENFQLSPFTGYTRTHWLEITEKIISGVLPFFNTETGMPELPAIPEESAFQKLPKNEMPDLSRRGLERIMMAVIIYSKATGNDSVPGYNGSITAPFIKAITRGTDPQCKGYWGSPEPKTQVGSVFALGAYINPQRFWEPLSPKEKENILLYLVKHADNPSFDNNHYFFHMTGVALCEKYGMKINRASLTKKFERIMGWYRGDGWFLDGTNRGFDYYNFWGFQLYNQILYKYDPIWKEQFGSRIEKATARFLDNLPYFYGRDGGPIPWGRSLSYRFASNAAIGWATLNNLNHLPPGQARRIASGTLKYFWTHGCLGSNGLLNIGFWGANTSVAESYLSPGDPYWATQGLACLLIPETDPFWTSHENPMPADGAGGKISVTGAQFTIRVSPIDGEARLFPVGQPFRNSRTTWQVGEKYDQHAYSSFLGVCLCGEGAPNIGVGRTGYSYDGNRWFFREKASPVFIDFDQHASIYKLQAKDECDRDADCYRDEVITHTLVGNDGEILIVWHNNPEPIYLHLGGYGINVPHDCAMEDESLDDGIRVTSGEYCSVLQAIRSPAGKFKSLLLVPRNGWLHSHLFGGKGAYPFWRSSAPVPPHVPVVFYVNGARGRIPKCGGVDVQFLPGSMQIKFEGKTYSVGVIN